MDMTHTRRTRLLQLRDERFDGKSSAFAEAIGRSESYVSRVLSGKKGLGEAFCRDVEERLGLAPMWLDDLAEVRDTGIDALFLSRCLSAVDLFIGRRRKSASQDERIERAVDLYSVFHGQEASAEQMSAFLERWAAVARTRPFDDD